MAVRHPFLGAAHACLNTFAELLRRYPAEKAITKFSQRIQNKKLDVVSKNALRFVTRQADTKKPKEEMLSRVHRAKHMLDSSTTQLSNVAPRVFRNKNLVVHPLSRITTPLLKSAKKIHFIIAKKGALKDIPFAEAHKPLIAPSAIENADFVLIESKAISKKGVIVENGGRMLSMLAKARGIPIYALATSWHVVSENQLARNEECIPPEMISAVVSEHGTYAFRVFLARVQKAFPWITSSP
ncbi:MAG: hypothetical protein QXT19_00645 [Candidatus Woesearchaeota archaeon]